MNFMSSYDENDIDSDIYIDFNNIVNLYKSGLTAFHICTEGYEEYYKNLDVLRGLVNNFYVLIKYLSFDYYIDDYQYNNYINEKYDEVRNNDLQKNMTNANLIFLHSLACSQEFSNQQYFENKDIIFYMIYNSYCIDNLMREVNKKVLKKETN